MTRWRPTEMLVRGLAGAAVLVLAAVLLGRPDLLVLATPLAVCAGAALPSRPTGSPRLRSSLGAEVVGEGQGTSLLVGVASDDPV